MKKIFLAISLFWVVVTVQSQNFANSSVLNTGTWHKMAVEKDGVYKIDFSFLNENGINPQNISFSSFGIFGQGMGMLPEENAISRIDDLKEIGIKINDQNNNGQWDNDDFVLFYAKGPHTWRYDIVNETWFHTQNIYADQANYFITTNQGTGKVIANAPVVNSPNSAITVFDDWQFFEEETYNLIQTEFNGVSGMGRKWFGNVFNNIVPDYTVNFSFPNIVSSSLVKIKSNFAAAGVSNSQFSIKKEGITLYTQNVANTSDGGDYPYAFKETNKIVNTFTSSSSSIALDITFSNGSSQSKGWLDYIEIVAQRQLKLVGNWTTFRNFESTINNTAKYNVSSTNGSTEIWKVTTPTDIQKMNTSGSSTLEFSDNSSLLQEYVAVNTSGSNYEIPQYVTSIHNQNLHGLAQADMLIITNDEIAPAAEDLADFHRSNDNLSVHVVMIDEIYNEYSSGQQDLCAIRDFLRMFYERSTATDSLRYVLLFGDASFDYKDRILNNTNIIPTYENMESNRVTVSYASDDFIGILENHEGGVIDTDLDNLDVAIGRIPVVNNEDAQAVVDKIRHYKSREGQGAWLNELTFVADDEDGNLHFNQVEDMTSLLSVTSEKDYNVDKIYLDSYTQVNAAGGDRYPDVLNAILRKIETGTFLLNYTGHGGPKNWAQERVFNIDDMRQLDNKDNLPLIITATCDFAPYDGADFHSAGEVLITNPNGGAIAMITTTRLVYATSNFFLNSAILNQMFKPINGRMPTLGEIMMKGKNSVNGNDNNRKFSLLGDPALTLNYPSNEVVTTKINNQSIAQIDTITALSKVRIEGEVRSQSGQLLSDFDGVVYPTIFDKSTTYSTRANDPNNSNIDNFGLQNNIIFKGAASVEDGLFSFEFIVPKDINYAFDNGKISYYAIENNTQRDANGHETNFIVGGTTDSIVEDNKGPIVDVFINDTTFSFGGLTDENPTLIVKLRDDSGINTVGTGVGHDILGVLDENTQAQYQLNDYYEAKLDDFTSGKISYPFNELEEGLHQISVKAWDVHNNSGEGYTEFIVAESSEIAIRQVLNYPNPFTTHTSFIFEHNHPQDLLDVQVQVYSLSGKIVKTIFTSVQSEGNRIVPNEITWDGLDDYGDAIGKGVYIYKVTAKGSEGTQAHQFEKLVILR